MTNQELKTQFDLTNPYEIAKYIKAVEKTTPVKVYLKGYLRKNDLEGYNYFGEPSACIILGEASDVATLIEAKKDALTFVKIEFEGRNSAIPMLDLLEINARVEPGAHIREGAHIGRNAVIMMGAVINIGAMVRHQHRCHGGRRRHDRHERCPRCPCPGGCQLPYRRWCCLSWRFGATLQRPRHGGRWRHYRGQCRGLRGRSHW